MNTGGGAPGGKCKVVAGPHKGGTGTYDDENSCCWDSGNQRICVDCDKGGAYPDGMCRDAKVIRPGYGRLRVPTRGMTISR